MWLVCTKHLKFKKHTDHADILKTIKNYREGVVNIKYVFHSLYKWCLKYFSLIYTYIKQVALQMHAGLHIQWLLKK
jgi:hypothetical protein